jgi:RimJ/RimL family protein N-acetyltransferase
VIETERLLLRLPIEDDVPAIAEQIADPDVMRYIGDGRTGTLADAVDQIASMARAWDLDGFGRFVVVRRGDGAAIGRIGLLAWDTSLWRPGIRSEIGADAEIELGWTLARAAWGAGYATEAALAVRDWARGDLGLSRLVSLIHADNSRSLAVARKLGERHERDIVTWRGVPVQLWTLE